MIIIIHAYVYSVIICGCHVYFYRIKLIFFNVIVKEVEYTNRIILVMVIIKIKSDTSGLLWYSKLTVGHIGLRLISQESVPSKKPADQGCYNVIQHWN